MYFFRLYRQILTMNAMLLATYRGGLLNNLISVVVWGLFIIISMVLLTYRAPQVLSWSKSEMLLLTGVFSTIIGMFHTLGTPNFDFLVRVLYEGALDVHLLKPIDGQLYLSIHRINYISIVRLLIGIGFTWYVIATYSIVVSIPSLLLTCISVCIGFIIVYSVWFIALTILIWLPRLSNIRELLFSVAGLSRFPREAYAALSPQFAFIAFPILLVSEIPTKILLGSATIRDILTQINVAAVLLTTSWVVWRFALRHYIGAGN